MKKVVFIIIFICFLFCQSTYSYDECFDGDCYSHFNSWSPQGGIGCVKTGFKFDWRYKSRKLEPHNAFFYVAIHNASSRKCESSSVRNVNMLEFRSSSQRFVDFQELIKKAIDWSWIATNNKLKFSKKLIGDCTTDNHLDVTIFLIADATFKGTFIRIETEDYDTKKNYARMNFYKQDLTRLKKDLSALKWSLEDYTK